MLDNSIVTEFNDSSWRTISIPGADWIDLLEHIFNNVNSFRDSITYLHIGPVRFTRMTHDRECILIDRPYGTPKSILRPWLGALRANNINIVICTIYPACLNRYNRSSAIKHKNNTELLRSLVVIENQLIVNFNMQNNWATPYLHKRIFTRRHHSYAFRNYFLRDGLHPRRQITKDWIKEIKRVNPTNHLRVNCR